MGYTYPAPPATTAADVTTIHRFMQSPPLIARRLRGLLEQRYIADAILTGRFKAQGGAITYESGEPLGTGEAPKAVGPGGEYPLVSLGGGVLTTAKTTNWGQDTHVTDAAIARQLMNPVERGFTKLANQSVKHVDSVALSAVASAVTGVTAIGAALSAASAEQVLTAFLTAKAEILKLNEGYDPDTVVLDDISWAIVMAKFTAAGYLPRESGKTPILTGDFPEVMGLRWLATPNVPVANVGLVVDSKQLGGMADEDLGGPGYTKIDGIGVETKAIREDDTDRYRLRARRVTVPVITEAAAGRRVNLAA